MAVEQVVDRAGTTPVPTWGPAGDRRAEFPGLDESRETDEQWMTFVSVLRAVARESGGRVNPNVMRPLLRATDLHPRRVSVFYQLALHDGVLSRIPRAWVESDDVESDNQGKPCRVYAYTEAPTTGRRLAPGSRRPAPRRPRPHVWRDTVYGAWLDATHAWEARLEAEALGYRTESAEWEAEHPRPRLRDFMVHLSPGKEPS